jgi:hypothetical protein
MQASVPDYALTYITTEKWQSFGHWAEYHHNETPLAQVKLLVVFSISPLKSESVCDLC